MTQKCSGDNLHSFQTGKIAHSISFLNLFTPIFSWKFHTQMVVLRNSAENATKKKERAMLTLTFLSSLERILWGCATYSITLEITSCLDKNISNIS